MAALFRARSLATTVARSRPRPAGSLARCSLASWAALPAGAAPPPRSSHTVTRVEATGKLAVFGGEDEPRHAFDPLLYLYDTEEGWSTRGVSADGSSSPTLLLGHGAASVDSTVYVFGGRTGGTNCADDPDGVVCETETGTLLAL